MPDDGAQLHEYLSLLETVRFEPYGTKTLAECGVLAAERAIDGRFWAVCLQDGRLIGNLYLALDVPEEWRTWGLGYVMHPGFWNHGYATEAATALLDHCFGKLGAHRVVASCDPNNARSWKLMERLGMRREAHMLRNVSFRNDANGNAVWTDSYQYAVLDSEWRA